ncbi:MAG: hypothetical protein AAFO29_04170, partial [Actinomycetota bacterium]
MGAVRQGSSGGRTKARPAPSGDGTREALADPGNALLTGGVLVFVVGAAAVVSMDVSESTLSREQWFNFKLSVAAIAALLVAILAYRIWTYPIRFRRSAPVGDVVEHQLRGECEAMLAYALERGLQVNTADLAALKGRDLNGDELTDVALISALNEAHRRLTAAVYPAMPKTLRLLRGDQNPSVLGWLGPVRLVRMFMALAVVLLSLFVVLGLSIGVTGDGTGDRFFGGNLVDRSRVALYLVTSSALGATFAGLTKAFRYIGNLSYDEKYESSYWIRLVLGVVSGLILSIVLSQVFFGQEAESTTGFRITVPLLAVVGGFSSDLVYNMLRRVIDALETLVSGSASEQVEAAISEAESRNRAANLAERASIARRLIAIRSQVPADAELALRSLDSALADVLGETAVTMAIGERLDDGAAADDADADTTDASPADEAGSSPESDVDSDGI